MSSEQRWKAQFKFMKLVQTQSLPNEFKEIILNS